ncbi:substrate-binding domain-containing protein [Aestuariicoccus sp. MJ-SS9]|uniref:molybdate ABC transporter substrate-binding protein n=1 Tax=Aestuariicoccus sp. MJ-SS9 TaxID=3079855 RepID=UPI00290C6EBB|nr:substrate-binding domain-containing protein [Aestuariicoccus sp. MJ-SS9]MDU8913175.1 substrate-binding domain-containing protein [Aestuariicoccus sp. MJ-SS9]
MKIIQGIAFAASALVLGSLASAQDEAGLNKDYRTFHSDGSVVYGEIGDSYTSDLVMYLAGNQFMVMEELIKDFQSINSDIGTIYVETIPPGQILNGQILKQGQINDQDTAMNPDLYASVNLNHLKKLAGMDKMHDYMIYIHNKLELMVAEGNPKGIEGPEDLARGDLVQSHPNPLTEGIFRFYGSEMLKDMGLYEQVTANAECKSCWAIEGKTWFTSRHHRETPQRIGDGEADVGIVWTTEVIEAKAEGRMIDGVAIPAPLNKQDKVSYAIGALSDARNPYNAYRFLSYLGTERAQGIYASYGFVPATTEELQLKPLMTN